MNQYFSFVISSTIIITKVLIHPIYLDIWSPRNLVVLSPLYKSGKEGLNYAKFIINMTGKGVEKFGKSSPKKCHIRFHKKISYPPLDVSVKPQSIGDLISWQI